MASEVKVVSHTKIKTEGGIFPGKIFWVIDDEYS